MRIQDLAKELGKKPAELQKFLIDMGVKAKTPSQHLDVEVVEQVRDLFKEETKKNDLDLLPDTGILTRSHLRVSELADLLKRGLPDVMKAFLKRGNMVTLNTEIDANTAVEIAKDVGVILELEASISTKKTIRDHLDKIEEYDMDRGLDALTTRPPVITILGHVDHGKTLLLDTIRKSNVISGESGGITQHIGAYQVSVKGRKLTFLDTPGHAAFTALRARGAQVTDIAILVVAADEGIKPQTVEALSHAKAANVPIMVAINKVDKPDADIERVKQQLAEHDLLAEEWGGKTVMVPVSAKTKLGIDDLLDMIMLIADMLDLKANATGQAKGVVIESRLSRKKGPIATVLIKAGCLKVGDFFVIDSTYGKIRALLNDSGEKINEALPGTPVEILGISKVPQPGSILEVKYTESEAKDLAEIHLQDMNHLAKAGKSISLESLSKKIDEGEIQKLNLIIKADVNGSLEAILASLSHVSSQEVSVSILHSATGPINENDLMLAMASSALVIGFHVGITQEAEEVAEDDGIECRLYDVIYNIVDDVKKVIEGLVRPVFEEVETAQIEVRQLFRFSKVGVIAGCYVLSGKVVRNAQVRIFRGKTELFQGKISSLKRVKDDVREVAANFECGVVIDGFIDFQPGDILSTFEIRQKK